MELSVWTKEAASLFDPKDPTKTDLKATVHLLKRMLRGTPNELRIQDHFGKTLYYVLKMQPAGTLWQVLTGRVSTSDFTDWLVNEHGKNCDFKDPAQRYYGGEAWPLQTKECTDQFTTMIGDGSVILDGKTEEVRPSGAITEEMYEAQGAHVKALKELNVDLQFAFDTDAKAAVQVAKDLRKTIKELTTAKLTEEYGGLEVSEGELTGTTTMVSVKKLFNGVLKENFDVPVWTWTDNETGKEVANPNVPFVDPNYLFRPKELQRVLYAILTNQRMYLHGHTGTGKTTMIEQVAAWLNWQTERINFDSEITRMDLIGKVDMVSDGGVTVTQWQDGLLPKAMSSPTIAIFDEIDFCRPDVSYVMQSATEGNAMTLLEDNGRKVYPHSMFRMFATGNTVGQGDEHGMYQGARSQSLAFLDRFTVWMKVDYLVKGKRRDLISSTCPSLSADLVDKISTYVTEHLEAFKKASVLQPISPRGMLAVAKATEYLETTTKGETKDNLKEALEMVVLDRCTQEDYAVLKGIVDRVWK